MCDTSTKHFWWFSGMMTHANIVEEGSFKPFSVCLNFGNILGSKHPCTVNVLLFFV